MNFNDKNDLDPAIVLHTEENEFFQHDILKSSDSNNMMQIKSKVHINFPSKRPLLRGKQNDSMNTVQTYSKNVVTNHSFNGFFNQNAQKSKKSIIESIHKQSQMSDNSQQNYQVNSPTNFNSTGKLSNLQFIGDSSKNYETSESLHSEVKSFVKKYFPENFQTGNFHGKYFSIENFVEILFEEFHDLIGGQNGYNLIEQFAQKVFILFGDKIYFEDLFEKTLENGLTGLIFEFVKSINEDRRENQEFKENRALLRPTQVIQPNNPFTNKTMNNSGLSTLKSQKKSQTIGFKADSIGNSGTVRGPSEKISLDRFFGNSISKVKFKDHFSSQQDISQVNEENMEQVKQILEDYIESMYEEAESKLNKKYAQEMKKITLKYKETQKLLQKVNQRISNHYDTIQLEKEHEKKIKLHLEKQTEMENKIKKLEYELKAAKDDVEKEKLNSFKVEQESIKLKEKLEKYENAIFEKAMQKGSNQSSMSGSSIMKQTKNNSSIYSHHSPAFQQPLPQQNLPRFEVKIDTITEHRPIQIPVINTQQQSTYSPYVSRHLGNNGGLTPTRIREIERTPSVSPIKQRISFVKTQNPSLNSRIVTNQNDSKPSTNGDHLKVSNVEKVQFGEKIQLRPLSPIGKLGDLGSTHGSTAIGQTTVAAQNQNVYAQRTYSPIKVQFCSSRVSTVPAQNR